MLGKLTGVFIGSAQTLIGSGNVPTSSSEIQRVASKFRVLIKLLANSEKRDEVKDKILLLVQYMTIIYYNKEFGHVELADSSKRLASFLNELLIPGGNSNFKINNEVLITEANARLIIMASQHKFYLPFGLRFTGSIESLLELLEIVIPPNNSDELSKIYSALFDADLPIIAKKIDFGMLFNVFGWLNFKGKSPLEDSLCLVENGDYGGADLRYKHISKISKNCNICGANFTGATIGNFEEVVSCFNFDISSSSSWFTERRNDLWCETINSFSNIYDQQKRQLLMKLDEKYWGLNYKLDLPRENQSNFENTAIIHVEHLKEYLANPNEDRNYTKLNFLIWWIQNFRIRFMLDEIGAEVKYRISDAIIKNVGEYLSDPTVYGFLSSIKPCGEFEVLELSPAEIDGKPKLNFDEVKSDKNKIQDADEEKVTSNIIQMANGEDATNNQTQDINEEDTTNNETPVVQDDESIDDESTVSST